MFTALYPAPLPSELLQQLSTGATKLLMAVQAEPGAPQSRYIELVGKCERSVRNFGRELLALGLVRRTMPTAMPGTKASTDKPSIDTASPKTRVNHVSDEWTADLTEVQRHSYRLLRQYRIEHQVAHDLVQQCDEVFIAAAIDYTHQHSPQKPTGYLVWCLKNVTKWYSPAAKASDFYSSAEMTGEALLVDGSPQADSGPLASTPAFSTVPIPESDPSTVFQANAFNSPTVPLGSVKNMVNVPELIVTEETLDRTLLAYAVEAATGVDLRLSREARQAVLALDQAGYIAEDVGRFADEEFPQTDWRGRKGERPTVQMLLNGIGAVRQRKESWPLGGLFSRIQAIRSHLPDKVSIRSLSDLWLIVEKLVTAEEWAASHCMDCHKTLSMCRCVHDPNIQ